MTGKDFALFADQDRIGEAEPPDAIGNLADLPLGMGPGIAGMWPQAGDRHRFDRCRLDGARRRGLGVDRYQGRQHRSACIVIFCRRP
jgi:hypothetical protein